jgi:hypothetical protein
MSTDHPIPPDRDLPPDRLAQRRDHLLAEIAREPASRRLFSWRAAAPALAVALVLAALLLVSPWHAPSLTDRALAALGDGPVLHIVTTERIDPLTWYGTLFDIETGQVVPETREKELWFDEGRGLKRTVERIDGVVHDEVLQTPAGGFTRGGGRIITCAWIAAHPVEATKLRVSCNENMENGTTPRHVPEELPTLDPALSGFADNYRAALESGRATEIARDTIDGRDVIWLRFSYERSTPPGRQPAPGYTQDVAVDASTYRPVRLRSADLHVDAEITVAETIPYDGSLFPRPADGPPSPSYGRGRGEFPLELPQAAGVLGRPALWLGEEWAGLRLVEVERADYVTAWGRSGREPTVSSTLRLTYAPKDDPANGPTLAISESTTCQFALRWHCDSTDPGPGQLRDFGVHGDVISMGLARTGGVHVSLMTDLPDLDLLPVVQSLEPVP